MLLKNIATAVAGRQAVRLFGNGALGAAAAAAVPFISRRGLGPLGFALTAGWAGKKIWNYRKARKQTYPADAAVKAPRTA